MSCLLFGVTGRPTRLAEFIGSHPNTESLELQPGMHLTEENHGKGP